MSIGFDGQAEADVLKAVRDLDKRISAGLDQQFSGVAAGNTNVRNPQLFKLWFEQQCDPTANPPGDPDWLLALPFVEGGAEVVRRYMAVSGVTGHGVNWQDFARQLAAMFAAKRLQMAGVA